MIRQRVASSTIRTVAYDIDKRILEVETVQHGTLIYNNVPLSTWHFFMAAPSKGAFFYQKIKQHYPQL